MLTNVKKQSLSKEIRNSKWQKHVRSIENLRAKKGAAHKNDVVDKGKVKIFLQKILGVENQARKDSVKQKETIKAPMVSIENKPNKKTVLSQSKGKGTKKQKQKRRQQPKCQYWRNQVDKMKLKLKNNQENTCGRAKMRAKVSYRTMWIIFQQCFEQLKILERIKRKKKIYKEFIATVNVFMEKNKKCESNAHWNVKMLEVDSEIVNLCCIQ